MRPRSALVRHGGVGALIILAVLPNVVEGGNLISTECRASSSNQAFKNGCDFAKKKTPVQCAESCDDLGNAVQCKEGCTTYEGLKLNSSYCVIGTYGDGTEDTVVQCKACAKGRFGISVGLHQYPPSTTIACTGCAKGKFGTSTGKTSSAESCTGKCTMGKYGDVTGLSACKGCNTGRWSNVTQGTQCEACAAGRWSSGVGMTTNTCKDCSVGRYQKYTGTSSCSACAAGRFGTATKAISSAQCEACVAGRWSSGVGMTTNTCKDCSAGRYQSKTGRSSCSYKCAAGRFGTATKAISSAQCTGVCSIGRWESGTGKTSNDQCNGRCSKGRFSNATGLTKDSQCAGLCPRGKFGTQVGATASSKGCTGFCSKGKWSNSTGLSSDAECPWCLAGRFSNETGLTGAHQCSGRCSAGRFGIGFVAQTVTDPAGCTPPLSAITNQNECRRLARALSLLPPYSGYDTGSSGSVIKTTSSSYPYGCSTKNTGMDAQKTYYKTGSSSKKCGQDGFKCICKYNISYKPALGDFSNPPTNDSHCVGRCMKGKWSNRTGLTSDWMCNGRCGPGRYGNKTGLASNEQCAGFPRGFWSREIAEISDVAAFDEKNGLGGPCPEGRWSDRTGLSAYVECSPCAMGRFSTRIAATSECTEPCPPGRWSGSTGLSSGAQCLAPSSLGCALDIATLLKRNVQVDLTSSYSLVTSSTTGILRTLQEKGWSNLDTVSNQTILFGFGDLLRLKCAGAWSLPPKGPSSIVCAANGKFLPDAISETTPFGSYTRCDVVLCEYFQLPLGTHAILDLSAGQQFVGGQNSKTLERTVSYTTAIPAAEAPATFHLGCAIDARVLMVDETNPLLFIELQHYALKMRCDYAAKAWLIGANPQQIVYTGDVNGGTQQWYNAENTRCQCAQGMRRGDGERVGECIECSDNTYAPINARHERVECRACPREGVSCLGGKLTVWEDWWFEVPPTLKVNSEGRLGMQTDTALYKCADRNACLPNKTSVPMTMYCDENHTSVICARCYHRREDCDRGVVASTKVGKCVPPTYFQRDKTWMYFAKIARHCQRCPAGSAANMSYLLTAAVAVGMILALALLVVAQLENTETRLREIILGETTRANSTGPIARLLLNWMQATALLTTIKFTPPDAVKEVGVWAEYAQGISTKSFFIRCALRWDYYLTFVWELVNPVIACAVPALLVILTVPIKRRILGWWRVRKYSYNKWSLITQSEEDQLESNRMRTAAKLVEKKSLAKEAARLRSKRLRDRGFFEIESHLGVDLNETEETDAVRRMGGADEGNIEAEGEDSDHEKEEEEEGGGGGGEHSSNDEVETSKTLQPMDSLHVLLQRLQVAPTDVAAGRQRESCDSAESDETASQSVVPPAEDTELLGSETSEEDVELLGSESEESGTPTMAMEINAGDWWMVRGIAIGDPVTHPRRGEGVVVAINPDDDGRIHVQFSVAGSGSESESRVHRYRQASWHKLTHESSAWWVRRWQIAQQTKKDREIERVFDTRAGFYANVTDHALQLRAAPQRGAAMLSFAVHPYEPFRAEERIVADANLDDGALENGGGGAGVYLRAAWKGGSGWLPLRDDNGVVLIRPIAASQVITSFEYGENAVAPVEVQESELGCDVMYEDDSPVLHRFRALEALCPESGITRDVIDLIFPAATTEFELDGFMRRYDLDRDGRLNFKEYEEADDEVKRKWRFKSVWAVFAVADLDHGGTLTADEMSPFMPASTTELERPKWLAIADRHGAHDVITIADLPALLSRAQRDERHTIGNASVTMAIFICYIRTAKAIMAMFSTESINGVSYLKEEVGTRAYTPQHLANIAVAAVYGFFFVICIPVAAMYNIYINRARFNTRKVQAAFGFLFEGYRPKMFFWEFVVVVRKVVILGVALFWEDAFLQSITALFVLVVSIIVHMACWPYEELFLNVAELCSLLCLFTLVALAVLLWYVQQPGKVAPAALILYELFVSSVIFAAYGGLLVALFARIVHLEIRERSKLLVKKFPGLRSLFEWFVAAEVWLHFNITKEELKGQGDTWGFMRKVRHIGEVKDTSDGVGETSGEKVQRLFARVRPALDGIGRAARGGTSASSGSIAGGDGVMTQSAAPAASATNFANPAFNMSATLNPLNLTRAEGTKLNARVLPMTNQL